MPERIQAANGAWFEVGQAVIAVEHDERTRRPKDGNPLTYRGRVRGILGVCVIVKYDESGLGDQFYLESGWRSWDGAMRWRLQPALTATSVEAHPDDGAAISVMTVCGEDEVQVFLQGGEPTGPGLYPADLADPSDGRTVLVDYDPRKVSRW